VSHATACEEDQIRILRLLHLLQTLSLHRRVDVLLCHLGQDRVLYLVGVVRAPGVGVIPGETLTVVVVDRNLLPNRNCGRDTH
jgi:hypothetical protein